MKLKNHEMNLCEGAILPKLLLYALPLIATNILQILFNAADVAVLGIFLGDAGDAAVAAVGATGAVTNLIIGLFVGLSIGANVIVARRVGEGDRDGAHRVIGTSVFISVFFGAILAVIGVALSRPILILMDCDPEVLDMACTYMRIYFIGMPIIMLYNFCASILRAVGDTVRPLIYLVISGIVNVILNVFFVAVVHLDVEGVAIATVVSQLISSVLSLVAMVKNDGYAHLERKYIKLSVRELVPLTKMGLPAGLQGCVFSLSNVLIQSSINSFGKNAMAGNTIGSQFDSFIYNAMYGVSLAALAFVSQNLGAGNIRRMRRSVRMSIVAVMAVWLVVGGGVILFREPLVRIMTDNPETIAYAEERLYILATSYFLCGIMDTLSSAMRGMGKSTTAMVVSLSGSCILRIIWLGTVFRFLWTDISAIYAIYPISWAVTILIYLVLYFPTLRATEKRINGGAKDFQS